MVTNQLNIEKISWETFRIGELIENLAHKSKLSSQPINIPHPPENLILADDSDFTRWMDKAAGYLNLEVEPINTPYSEVNELIKAAAPAIIQTPKNNPNNQPRLFALVQSGRKRSTLLCPDLKTRKIPNRILQSILCAPYEATIGEDLSELLKEAQVPTERIEKVKKAILNEQLSANRIEAGWLLRNQPGSSIFNQFKHADVFKPIYILLTMYFIQQILTIASWAVIGRGIFQGNFDSGWLFAWALLLFSTIPVQIIVNDAQGELSMNAGAIFKQRLIQGTLKLEPEEIRHQGMGQFLGRVMESEAVEMLAFSGGFMALLSIIEVFLAIYILNLGIGGTLLSVLLVIWVIITTIYLYRYYKNSLLWSDTYRDMTNDLVERMVGHRTRLAQEDPLHWHDEEDQSLDKYLQLSRKMDNIRIQLNSIISRGWIIAGLTGLLVPYITGAPQPQMLAISLGGILFASQALGKFTGGVQSITGLAIAWKQVGPLFHAASRSRELADLSLVSPSLQQIATKTLTKHEIPPSENNQLLIFARDLSFRYQQNGRPVLDGCSLMIYPGDRILLEGPSGGGKSTLASLLTGLRKPDTGSLLLWGFDRQILGSEEWRRHVVMAPQFQENYVFSETFAFNLLMGRRWPPKDEDLQDAEKICRKLGLGELLDRMPSGFQQMLGESGWQLSHGERSRLFIARTLLQNADLLVFDESFGALDPENLKRSLQCVLDEAKTLIVIAHP